MTSGQILYWMPNCDLRQRHVGLAATAKKEFKVDVNKLKPGELIMFINSRWTQFMVYCSNGILLHYRSPEGKHLNVKALQLVPKFMKNQRIDYGSALREAIEKEFRAKYPKLAKQEERLTLAAKR